MDQTSLLVFMDFNGPLITNLISNMDLLYDIKGLR